MSLLDTLCNDSYVGFTGILTRSRWSVAVVVVADGGSCGRRRRLRRDGQNDNKLD